MPGPPNSEVEQFLQRVSALRNAAEISLDNVLKPSLDIEAELRSLFATNKSHERLANAYVGLVDVFDAPDAIRATHARVVKDDEDLSARYIMPLPNADRRADGAPCMISDVVDFKKNWDVFTEGSLSQLPDWNNIVAAGGAVLACLTPLPEAAKGSRRNMRKYYAYPTSDVDLFLWGLSLEETEAKIKQIYEAVRETIPWDVTCVRTKNTVSIHSQFPYRTIQIILRQYASPAEILVGFDVDAGCCLYDGSRVYASPRAIIAMMRQCNTIDETRRSSSYEIRLSKYAVRGFEIYYPSLKRGEVDPTIYERSLTRIEGLARLLVLEKLANSDVRYTFLESRRTLRGRPNPLRRYNKRKRRLQGDLKGELSLLEMSEYDVVSLHIPYGPGWNARRIDKLVYQTDLSMNSTFNPKNKGRRLHRHPAFFGTVEECMEDCCGNCPVPIDEDERKAQEEEDNHYIRGRISFIPQDHGRLRPAEVDEWSTQAYIGPTEKFFTAIAAGDRTEVSKMLKDGIDINRRDHVGRTPLHMAILSGAVDIACDLVHAGARITAQMVDGRTSLHLAAQLDQLDVVRTVLERSALNQQQLKVGGEKDDDAVETSHESDSSRPSSEDDWSSEDDDGKVIPKKKAEGGEKAKPLDIPATLVDGGDLPEDEDVPDVFDVNGVDWDLNFTPLCHAVLFSSPPIVELLLNAGADATFVSLTNDQLAVLPLALTILTEDEDRACKIAQKLVAKGASSSAADWRGTIFHRAVVGNKLQLVSTLLRCDPNARTALNFPTLVQTRAISPLITAVHNQNYSMLAVLLAHGAKLDIAGEDLARAAAASLRDQHYPPMGMGPPSKASKVYYPVETALTLQDNVAKLLLSLGAETDFKVGARDELWGGDSASTLKLSDWIHLAVHLLSQKVLQLDATPPIEISDHQQTEPPLVGWPACLAALQLARNSNKIWAGSSEENRELEKQWLGHLRDYLAGVSQIIFGDNAANQTFSSNLATTATFEGPSPSVGPPDGVHHQPRYQPFAAPRSRWFNDALSSEYSPAHLESLYDDLFEACFAGSNEKIQQLFIPGGAADVDKSLFYISVQVAAEFSGYGTGITPLVAAIAGRHWDTARLIMTIAGLQYKPVEKPMRFSTVGIRLDASDHDYDGSDVTVDQAVVKFVDIAKTGATAQCDVYPNLLLSAPLSWYNEDGSSHTGSPLTRAVYDDDFEAFVNIANLYKPHSELDSDSTLLAAILAKDRPKMLDEYIRRTGAGLAFVAAEGEGAPAVTDQSRVYTGLSVHGAKRMDLAKQNDPNAFAPAAAQADPLLWQAAGAGACEVVEYLAGERPLAAYRFYAASNSDERARGLRRVLELDKALPELLGWGITPLGESPLFAAVGGKSLPLIKKLFSKAPQLMRSALHERVKGLGVNAVMFAVYLNCPIDLVDFLLAQSISPVVVDETNGWNIFHYMCNQDHEQLLHHLLHKLPRDVVEVLLCQQSKDRLETPLHRAVVRGCTDTVRTLLAFSHTSLRLRNADGSTALHAAVQYGFPAIVAHLAAAPGAGLALENGVGHMPREMAAFQVLVERTHAYKKAGVGVEGALPETLPPAEQYGSERRDTWDSFGRWRPPLDAGGRVWAVRALEKTLARLVSEGTLDAESKLGRELFAFAGSHSFADADAEAEVDADVEAEVDADAEVEGEDTTSVSDASSWMPSWRRKDTKSRERTLLNLSAAPPEPGRARELVRLTEVQASVEASLARVRVGPGAVERNKDGEGDGELQQLHRSLVFRKMLSLEDIREGFNGYEYNYY
ncbi:ankyrin repeat protein [Mycena vulgaris]|nr:ankyrin repeat protein [Mycena vulgaris]